MFNKKKILTIVPLIAVLLLSACRGSVYDKTRIVEFSLLNQKMKNLRL